MTSPIAFVRGVFRPNRDGGLSSLVSSPSGLWSAVSDGRLMYEIADGDVVALGELFDRHGAWCWTVAKQVAADDRAADEAVHAAFLEIWKDTPKLADPKVQQRLVALTFQHAIRGKEPVNPRPVA